MDHLQVNTDEEDFGCVVRRSKTPTMGEYYSQQSYKSNLKIAKPAGSAERKSRSPLAKHNEDSCLQIPNPFLNKTCSESKNKKLSGRNDDWNIIEYGEVEKLIRSAIRDKKSSRVSESLDCSHKASFQ